MVLEMVRLLDMVLEQQMELTLVGLGLEMALDTGVDGIGHGSVEVGGIGGDDGGGVGADARETPGGVA